MVTNLVFIPQKKGMKLNTILVPKESPQDLTRKIGKPIP